MSWIVYKHTSPNQKVYIGITSQSRTRRWQHGLGYRTQQYFWRAIQKYGWDNFKHEVLFENLTAEEASEKEIELIAFYQSWHPEFGYNVSTGGGGSSGYHLSDEQKGKIGRRTKELWENQEYRDRIITSLTGRPVTDETKKKLRNAMTEFYSTEDGEKLRHANQIRTKRMWEDTAFRERMNKLQSLATTRLWQDENYRKRQIEAHIGIYAGEKHPMYRKTHSAEAKAIIGKKSKEMWADPDFRDTHSKVMSVLFSGEGNPFWGKRHSVETKQKISESRKGKCCGADNPQFGKPISESAKEKMRVKKSRPVEQLDPATGEVIKVWPSIKAAYEVLHIRHISEVCGSNTKYKSAGGFGWRYKL